MSFTKTLLLWQSLNSFQVLLRYRVCYTRPSGWLSQPTPSDLFALASIQLGVSPLVALPLAAHEAFLNHALVVNLSTTTDPCFLFLIIMTTMTTHTGALWIWHPDFTSLQAQRSFFRKRGGCFCVTKCACVGYVNKSSSIPQWFTLKEQGWSTLIRFQWQNSIHSDIQGLSPLVVFLWCFFLHPGQAFGDRKESRVKE